MNRLMCGALAVFLAVWLVKKLFKRNSLIMGRDIDEQLLKTAETFGGQRLLDYCKEANIELTPKRQRILKANAVNRIYWKQFQSLENDHLKDSDAHDLLDKMLRVHPV